MSHFGYRDLCEAEECVIATCLCGESALSSCIGQYVFNYLHHRVFEYRTVEVP